MSGLFGTFNISKRGMNAQQMALNVTSHNIANANTEGYSVQRANLKTTEPFMMPSINSVAGAGQVGTGVEVSTITRARNEFLDYYIRKEYGTLAKYESREEFLTEIETIFMEPSDTGLASVMGKFWDSWQQLATTPESPTARELVAQNADTLAKGINNNYWQLEKLEENAGDILKNQVNDVSSILKQVTDLNNQIKAVVVAGKIPNDLMDRRDLLLNQLSERFNFDTEKTEYGGIKINAKIKDGNTIKSVEVISDSSVKTNISYINKAEYDAGNKTLKLNIFIEGNGNDPAYVKEITVEESEIEKYANIKDGKLESLKSHVIFYDGSSSVIDSSNSAANISAFFENGSINGYETVSSDINEYKQQLNTLAKALAISVNTVHSNSLTASDTNSFFNIATETADEPAKVIAVNEDIIKDPSKINAGKDVPSTNAGNGERALLIGQLRNTRMDILTISNREAFVTNVFYDIENDPAGKTKLVIPADKSLINLTDTSKVKLISSPSGSTIDSYFKDTVSNLGVKNQEAKRIVKNQEVLINQLETRRESISGVSLDEEMTNMIQFQRAYEANAKLINVIDQLLDVVVNGLIRR